MCYFNRIFKKSRPKGKQSRTSAVWLGQKHINISTQTTVKSSLTNQKKNLGDSDTKFPGLNKKTTNLTAWQIIRKEWSENRKMFTAGPIIRYFVQIQAWCHIWLPHWERNICKCLYYFGSTTSHVFSVINEWFLWDWIKAFIFHDCLPNSHVFWQPLNSTRNLHQYQHHCTWVYLASNLQKNKGVKKPFPNRPLIVLCIPDVCMVLVLVHAIHFQALLVVFTICLSFCFDHRYWFF